MWVKQITELFAQIPGFKANSNQLFCILANTGAEERVSKAQGKENKKAIKERKRRCVCMKEKEKEKERRRAREEESEQEK